VTQAVEHLLSKPEALSSNPSTAQNEEQKKHVKREELGKTGIAVNKMEARPESPATPEPRRGQGKDCPLGL
jgi:hypothetical protein